MSTDTSTTPAPSTTYATAVAGGATSTGTVTREQQRRNNAEQDAIDDSDAKATTTDKTTNDAKAKTRELFKGKVDKMDGHVFQLAEEGRKGNQFTQTLEALENYVAIELDHAKDLAPLFASPAKAATIPEPDDQPPFGSDGITRVTRDHRFYIAWKFECETYNARLVTLEANERKLFTIILLQCSQSVKMKLEGTAGYEAAKGTYNCTWLLTTLKNVCHKFEHTENRFVALVNAKAAIFNCRQGASQSTTDYYESFKELLSVLEAYNGQLHDPPDAAPESANIKTLPTIAERNTYMREHYSAILFLRNADNTRFDELKAELSNGFSKGRDEYPATLIDAHQLLLANKGTTVSKKTPNTNSHNRSGRHDSGRGGPGRGTSPGRGSGRSGRTFVQVAFCLAQIENYFPQGIPNHYVLLDSDSTVSIFCNADLLTNIHDVDEPLYLETNGGGYQVSTQMGTVKDFGPVWYNPESIANVLSLAQVRLVRRVTMDTADSPAFHVHKPDGTGVTIFGEHESGLYLYDASAPPVDKHSNDGIIGYSSLQTIAHNKTKFTGRQIEAADAARKLYRLLGRPGHAHFLSILRENHILNCPITVDDAQRAQQIYGKDVAFLKGKTTASPAKNHILDFTPISLPPELLCLHPNVTLCFDLFYVLGIGFSLSTSRNLRYLSCHFIADRTKPNIKKCIAADLALYRDRGFNPNNIHADGEYNSLQTAFPDVRFTICAAEDHVPEIERAIRTVKENIRTTIHGMPYSSLPRVLVKELATAAIRNLNMFPHPDGVSATLSPATIVTGQPKIDYQTMRLEFGTYVQVYDGTSNDTKSRTLGAIATNPTGNSSGDYYFMSLATGHRIQRRSWTVLPISDNVISRVEGIAFNEEMPLINTDPILNEYDPDATIDESEYDRTYKPPSNAYPQADLMLTSDAYTDTDDSDEESFDVGHHPDFDDDDQMPGNTQPSTLEEHKIIPTAVNTANTVSVDIEIEPVEEEERNRTISTDNEPVEEEERSEPVEEEERTSINRTIPTDNEPVEEEERTTTRNTVEPVPAERPSGLRPKQPANYKYRYGFTQTNALPDASINRTLRALESTPPATTEGLYSPTQMQSIHKAIVGLMFTQMSAQKGIKKHGQLALNALRKEFEQFRALDVLEPLDAFTLTDEQKAEALRALSVIKEKRDGTIKGRTCADGSPQQGKFSKAETGSPTIANDALFMSIMIDAFENRDVGTADIGGAYLHALMKRFISMRFVGWAVDLLCDVNPEYKQYVVYEGKTKVLYVRCNKAIYGCVVSGVLWYELFSETLALHGFTVNPYDFCVANATIDGSQCTIGWFVDDTKISHVNPTVVTNIINILESRFGKMKVTRGHHHKFLGMDITYLGDGTATIHMPSYISEAIEESGLDVSKPASSPCASSLLSIDSNSPLLEPTNARRFHSIVAKLIYVGTRARTDILLALSFLCGRVSHPTEQDEKKLQRLLSYLKSTIDLRLRLGADSLNQFITWVDASFAVHADMRSHTGGVISFGRGGLICKSKRQTINTKSSTEAELIGASDYLPNTLYVKLFMEAQGYPITSAIFKQDNESAIKMQQNGKASCGQRSRHIDIRYFFITDHSKRNSIHIQHCPTGDMLADFFTKPLQGSLFRKFRSVLLGEDHTNILSLGLSPPSPEERVGSKKTPSNTGDTRPGCTTYPITNHAVEKGSPIVNVNTSHSIEKYPEDNTI
jgi:hypothetical protein